MHASPLFVLGGFCLAGVAGYVNAAALTFFHVPISHMSGAFTHLGTELFHNEIPRTLFLLSLIGAFLLGAAASGLIIGATQLRPARRYGVALSLEGLTLGLVGLLIGSGSSAGIPVAAFACGLQNGMASSYYGLIVRTTHVTGILTDLGVLLGQFLRYRQVERWKFVVLCGILIGFLGGSVLGSFAAEFFSHRSFYLPGLGCLSAGSIYFWIIWSRAADRPSQPV